MDERIDEFRRYLKAEQEFRDCIDELNEIKAQLGNDLQFSISESGNLEATLHGNLIY
jgi:hypothetical protein